MTRALTDAQRRDWLRLARTENVGPVTFAQLIARFGEPSLALAALPDLARRGGRMAGLKIPDVAEAERELAAGEALGARMLASCEPAFPLPLAALDPPPLRALSVRRKGKCLATPTRSHIHHPLIILLIVLLQVSWN